MAGAKQSKRVSWPNDGNLCKVRLFLSEDAPSQSGLGAQDNLQAKAAWLLHAAGLANFDDSLPPGFGAPQKKQPKIDTSQIPMIKWQCPPTLVLKPEWRVVAGEESVEVALENQRQPGVLEAVYPRPSSIPPNPIVTPDVQTACFDDSCTPVVPIMVIEEEDGIELPDMIVQNHSPVQLHDLPNAGTSQNHILQHSFTPEQAPSQSNTGSSMSNTSQSERSSSSVSSTPPVASAQLAEPDVMAAASAAFTAIMRSSEEGSLIDRDLLINILSNPDMVQKLLTEYGDPIETPSAQQHSVSTAQATASRLQQTVSAAQTPSSRPQPQPVITSTAAALSWPPSRPLFTSAALAPSGPQSQTAASSTSLVPSWPLPQLGPPSWPLPQSVLTSTAAAPSRLQPMITSTTAAPSWPRPQPVIPSTATAPLRSPTPPFHLAPGAPLSVPPPHHISQKPSDGLPPLSLPPPHHILQKPAHGLPPPASNPHHSSPHMPIIPPAQPPPVKNTDYYKSLIHLHGGKRQEPHDQNHSTFSGNLVNGQSNTHLLSNNMDLVGLGLASANGGVDQIPLGGMNTRDPKARVPKPCAYFNTPRGCRHGASCLYQHDASSIPQRIEQQKGTTKRIKLDRGVYGPN